MKRLALVALLLAQGCSPDREVVEIYKGTDGQNGVDGAGCSSERQNFKHRVKITCGTTVTYVYDGHNGQAGASCRVEQVEGGGLVTCGNSLPVYIANGAPGPAGQTGQDGQPGRDGLNGQDGEDAVQPGLDCNVHNLANWDGVSDIRTTIANNPAVGSFVLPNLSVGDTSAAAGFPGMPAALQQTVGYDGYALDCYGYLNVPTSGLYNFSTLSDDGIRVVIQDQAIINNPGLHAPTTDTALSRDLNRGPNKINVIYYQGPHSQIALQLKWSGPNTAEQVVPAASFTH